MANTIVVNEKKVSQIRSRLSSLYDEIRDSAEALQPMTLATSKGAGARSLSQASNSMAWLAAALGYCAQRCDRILAEALEAYQQSDDDVARSMG